MTKRAGAGAVVRVAIGAAVTVAGCYAQSAGWSAGVSAQTELDAATRTATVFVTNNAAPAIIGGGLRVVFDYSDGSEKHLDLSFDLLPGVGLETIITNSAPGMHIGALKPGQTYRVQQIGPAPPEGSVVLAASAKVRALVFLDNSAAGDTQCIDDLFALWRDQATTLSAWNSKLTGSLSSGASAAAIQQLSGDAKGLIARHPGTQPRLRTAAVSSQEEALSRDAPTLQYVAGLIDQLLAHVESHRTSPDEGWGQLKRYLQTRSETLAAHTQRKGGN